MSMPIRDVEAQHTLDQVVLLWYLDMKDERRDRDLSAQATGVYFAKFLSG